ncbi:Na-K-Cl cotransporter [Prolixibacter bellariivorans]|uniref:Na-K-Cl cotransporter n=1 Tax=Prolixibacter bellariivorans TaxID=314319 RepID=A0A5M4B0H4_9BACT|nr:amino acid permease [Prolixibacter bellariivorans]GET33366.1 Na-K-Cl cotransporter [Prolixibacter bellariivorans]
MSSTPNSQSINRKGFGTAPVFVTAICTILGAILFLRFGYAVGTVGFFGVIGIIIIGHLVTIPTALSLSEIATNRKVEGGGEYFIISRSFGLNIGATIGIALFSSQAISVAFYVIAFTEAFTPFFDWWQNYFGWVLPRQAISLPVMAILGVAIIKRGANIGMKLLYIVAAILFVALGLFFAGQTEYFSTGVYHQVPMSIKNMSQFYIVFAIIFPAFTGMTAGVGLSGDLRSPKRSIPIGTLSATVLGMIVYIFIAWKLYTSASPDLLVNDQLVMGKIALGGALVVPIGLAASTLSSALGSVLVAPRTLQAIAQDNSFPYGKINRFLSKNDARSEPANASIVTVVIAFVFVSLGNVNIVAQIISMFFMVTYGSLNLISFLNHFGADPSYRPTFRSRWYISLLGFSMSLWLMFKMSSVYAFVAILVIFALYQAIQRYQRKRRGMAFLFRNAFFQLNRRLQVFLQKSRRPVRTELWRPSVISVSRSSFTQLRTFQLVSWISYRFGFGTYIHLVDGYYSKETTAEAQRKQEELIQMTEQIPNLVYLYTMVSPSYTSAVAQVVQLPGVSGMENNTFVFEYDRKDPALLKLIKDNFNLVRAGGFDILVLTTNHMPPNYKGGIHVWIQTSDVENANLMILLSYIITSHPSWSKSPIKIFTISPKEEIIEVRDTLEKLLKEGRLPISPFNIEIIPHDKDMGLRKLVADRSREAGLTMIGFESSQIKHDDDLFLGYENTGDILFVNSRFTKSLE